MKALFIVGPTASGKTAAAVETCIRLGGEVISADSIQIYSGLDIGSGKASISERRGVSHHMIDVASPEDGSYTVALYREAAIDAMKGIWQRGKVPVVCGGTGLYINALTYPLDFTETVKDTALRERLAGDEAADPGYLHKLLCTVDPETAARLHPHDIKRIIRAIEIAELTGEPMSAKSKGFRSTGGELPCEPVIIGLNMERERLYARIEARVDAMMSEGLMREAQSLTGLDPSLPALQGLGYKQLLSHLRGECSLDEAVADIKLQTRRYAKRQLTWFRRDERIDWIGSDRSASLIADDIVRIYGQMGEGDQNDKH